MTKEELEAIEARAAKATRGPWDVLMGAVAAVGTTDTYDGAVWGTIVRAERTEHCDSEGRTWTTSGSRENNLRFIAAARLDIPALTAALREGWARIEVLEGALGAIREAGHALVAHCAENAFDTRTELCPGIEMSAKTSEFMVLIESLSARLAALSPEEHKE